MTVEATKKSKKPRCFMEDCNAKLKLSDMVCRCEKRYCLKHRLPEDHMCSVDYKNVNPLKLEACVADKVIRI